MKNLFKVAELKWKNIKDFIKHISKYHGSGESIHEENGYYFLINEELRQKLKIIENEK